MKQLLIAVLLLGMVVEALAHEKGVPAPTPAVVSQVSGSGNQNNQNNRDDNLKHAAEIAVVTCIVGKAVTGSWCFVKKDSAGFHFTGKQASP